MLTPDLDALRQRLTERKAHAALAPMPCYCAIKPHPCSYHEGVEDGVDDVLALLEPVGWLGPYGIIPGGMDNEPNDKWAPLYRIKPTEGET